MNAAASAATLAVCNVEVSAVGHPPTTTTTSPPTPGTDRTCLAEVIRTVLDGVLLP